MKNGSLSQLIIYKQNFFKRVESTLVISKAKGHSDILRDIRTLTYQICRNRGENKSNSQISQMNEVRDVLKKFGKGEKLLMMSIFSSYSQYFITCH